MVQNEVIAPGKLTQGYRVGGGSEDRTPYTAVMVSVTSSLIITSQLRTQNKANNLVFVLKVDLLHLSLLQKGEKWHPIECNFNFFCGKVTSQWKLKTYTFFFTALSLSKNVTKLVFEVKYNFNFFFFLTS